MDCNTEQSSYILALLPFHRLIYIIQNLATLSKHSKPWKFKSSKILGYMICTIEIDFYIIFIWPHTFENITSFQHPVWSVCPKYVNNIIKWLYISCSYVCGSYIVEHCHKKWSGLKLNLNYGIPLFTCELIPFSINTIQICMKGYVENWKAT